jgi:hypothetical protein
LSHRIVQVYIWGSLVIPFTASAKLLPVPPNVMLDPGEALLDRIEVGRIRRQVKELDAPNNLIVSATTKQWSSLLCIAHVLNFLDMMDSAVIQDQDTSWSRIRIHYFQEAIKPLDELFAIVTTNFDMCIDKTVHGDRRKK